MATCRPVTLRPLGPAGTETAPRLTMEVETADAVRDLMGVLPGEPMAALVNAADRQDVEILWSEIAGLGDQIAGRISDSLSASNKLDASMKQAVEAATTQATTAGAPMAGAGMSGDVRQMMIDNLKRSLVSIPDPAQRKQVLDQYRVMGLDITPEELGL